MRQRDAKAKSAMSQAVLETTRARMDVPARSTTAASPVSIGTPSAVSVGTPSAVNVGTQGWAVPGWQGLLYPAGLKANKRLSLYARVFNSVEVNSTFYAPPAPETVKRWLADTPPEFRFALKMPRWITHERRLRVGPRDLKEFLRTAEMFEDKLGPILIQLPPSFGAPGLSVLSEFLRDLPVDSMQFCVEVRRPSLRSAGVRNLLHRRGVGLVTTNLLNEPGDIETINGIAYLRLLGGRRIPGITTPDPSRMTLDEFAVETGRWASALALAQRESGAEAYAFVSNDYYGPGILPAAQLMKHMGIPTRLRSGSFDTSPVQGALL